MQRSITVDFYGIASFLATGSVSIFCYREVKTPEPVVLNLHHELGDENGKGS